MRYARRVDKNQSEIVKAFRAAGAKVKVIHEPVDLQIWATNSENAASMYIEIKNTSTGYGRKGLNPKQLESMRGMPWAMVTNEEEAMAVLKQLRGIK